MNGTAGIDETGYTPGESEFADGAGTRLDQEIEELEADPDPDSYDERNTEQDADFENPEDNPA